MKVRIQGVEHKLECKPQRLADLNTIGYYTSTIVILFILAICIAVVYSG